MESIAIIGCGVVGRATAMVITEHKFLYDIKRLDGEMLSKIPLGVHTVVDKFPAKVDNYFICVPTNLNKDNTLDITKVIDVLDQIKYPAKVYIRSTLPIGTTRMLANQYSHLDIIYYPEFLRENSWMYDAAVPDRIVMSDNHFPDFICFDNTRLICGTHEEVEAIKLYSNAFLSTKLAFFHELHEHCRQLGMDYNFVKSGIVSDKRIGPSHADLPLVIGGKCLPKDLVTLITQTDSELFKAVGKRIK